MREEMGKNDYYFLVKYKGDNCYYRMGFDVFTENELQVVVDTMFNNEYIEEMKSVTKEEFNEHRSSRQSQHPS
jgi:hypothetical protein